MFFTKKNSRESLDMYQSGDFFRLGPRLLQRWFTPFLRIHEWSLLKI